MNPDVQAARRALLAHLQLPLDAPADLRHPAEVESAPPPGSPGWSRHVRMHTGDPGGGEFPRSVLDVPAPLRVVVSWVGVGEDLFHVAYVHRVAWNLWAGDLARLVDGPIAPGVFDAVVNTAAVSGWEVAARLLRESLR